MAISQNSLIEDPPLLGVACSVTGRRWVARTHDERLILALCQRHDIPDILARFLVGRGIGLEETAPYLTPRLKDHLCDPFSLHDMALIAETLAEAIEKKTPIGIFTDYDVDGATSGALMIRYLRTLGCPVFSYVPDRQNEGYGPNPNALAHLVKQGARLIITLDCGTTAHQALATAEVPVIIIDHHKAEPELPKSLGVVNPNRLDEEGKPGYLAAVGVTFLVVIAINALLRQRGFFTPKTPQPNPMMWLDLVALGTVCDAVPLIGLNRALVAQGLQIMKAGGNCGLSALMAHAKVTPRTLHADTLGFRLGPRINAGGRIGDSKLGLQLLTTLNPEEAGQIATKLDQLNQERRSLQETLLSQAIAQATGQIEAGNRALVISGADWHPGIIGIVAGRLAERYHRPAFVFSKKDTLMRGSGRSAGGFDLGAAVIAARQSGLALSSGGHREAAGITIKATQKEAFASFLRARVPDLLPAESQHLLLDAILAPQSITLDLAATLETAAPFGQANPQPLIALASARLLDVRPVGKDHVRCILSAEGKTRLEAVAFGAHHETGLGSFLLSSRGKNLHIAGEIHQEFWQGREKIAFHIKDVAPA